MYSITIKGKSCFSLSDDPERLLEFVKSRSNSSIEFNYFYKKLVKKGLKDLLNIIYNAPVKTSIYITLYLKKKEKNPVFRTLGLPVYLDTRYRLVISMLAKMYSLGILYHRECSPKEKDWLFFMKKIMKHVIRTRSPYNVFIDGERIVLKPIEPEALSYRHLLLALRFLTPRKTHDLPPYERRDVYLLASIGILKPVSRDEYVLKDLSVFKSIIETLDKRTKTMNNRVEKHIIRIREKNYKYYYIPYLLSNRLKNIKRTRRITDLPQLQEAEALIHELINTLDDAYLEEAENTLLTANAINNKITIQNII